MTKCPETHARTGIQFTSHGLVPTPVFMPVGTQATVKTLTPDDLNELNVQMILGNTYHLYLRPGLETIKKLGGLHKFMAWNWPILTDSGGFQIFSLGHLRRINDDGALFRSHIDGSEHFLTPELVIEAQEILGADIAMVLDECAAYGEDKGNIVKAMERSHLWARRCQQSHTMQNQQLFGIVHGGVFSDLRKQSAEFLTSLDFPGYAIGGLSLGEPKELMYSVLEETVQHLPDDKPRYLMGVGSPEDIVECVFRGVDMFDSALPTRLARNGAVFSRYRRYNIRNSVFKDENGSLDPQCDCYTCRHFSAAYLHHLFKCEELLAYRLATVHNLRFLMRLMEEIRVSIEDGTFKSFRDDFIKNYQPTDDDVRSEQKKKWLKARENKTWLDLRGDAGS